MNVHKNARLTPLGRERIVRQVVSGQTPEAVAQAAGVCPRTVRKWVDRYCREGSAGLQDRSSRPHRLRRPTPQTVVDADRTVAPPALDRQADRRRDRRIASNRQPGSASARLAQAQCLGARRTGSALRARQPGRTHPHRYQKARPHRLRRAPHHRPPNIAALRLMGCGGRSNFAFWSSFNLWVCTYRGSIFSRGRRTLLE